MDMFTVDANVARWETALLPLRGIARLPLLQELAWHLRQRDTARACALADEVLALLGEAKLDAPERQRAASRMALVKGEALWLSGALDQALEHAEAVLQQYTELDDAIGCADTHWLLGWIAVDRGEHERCDIEFAKVAERARGASDGLRTALAEATLARWAVLQDRNGAVDRWGGHFTSEVAHLHPSLATWIHDFLALSASHAADFGAAAAHFIQCYESALETGQLRAAITAATNIGEDFTLLNDHHAALEWMQCALELARPTGWPRSVGACLMHTADTMRRLGQREAAREMLEEALQILKPFAKARSYAIALQYLGDLSLDEGNCPAALEAFSRLQERADALNQSDFLSVARRGQAHALSQLNRPQEAIEVAATAVALADGQDHAYNHFAALRVMALIHARHALPPPPDMTAPNAALHYLNEALAVASTIDGYTVPGDLYDAMARQYASMGDYAKAYEVALQASSAREKTHSKEATNRAIAMQVHHRTEHARNEGHHHRELAESEARRAQVLQRTSATLERLSAIGQEITTHLDAGAVFQALDRHVHGLLTANTFAIYLTDQSGMQLNRAFGVEMGKPLPTNSIPLSHQAAFSVRCLAERREIYVENWAEEMHREIVPGTLENMSALFLPLAVGERTLGVMTVQALKAHAYDEIERLIFRTLCAYGAIALDNAEAYRQLQDAQTQLVSQEKLAALGSLMAGVAHELNTPIGNSLLIASTLQEKTIEIETLMNGPGLRRSELANFIGDSRKASTLVMRGLTSAADLVNSFKQVAVDRTTEQRRNFNLQQVCHEIIATMMNRIRAASHSIEMDVGDAIAMDSYPGPFGQVITNFINNALLHAFDNGKVGHMRLTASMPVEGRVLVQFSDDGGGIASQHLNRIFDPFFTTKLGQGGSGLGLSISYNIVTQLLGGQISVNSSAEEGTCFALDLPLTAPEHDPSSPATIY
jgi:signal transduction histidine kinase/tetratricopeptide (TPR) repeat protein